MKNFIILLIHFVLQNQWITITANKTKLGIAPCMYAGDFDKYEYYCPNEPMPIDWLPKECTSFIYDGKIYGSDDSKNFSDHDIENINRLKATGKPLYLYYGYLEQKSWIKVVDPANAKNETEKVAKFVAEFNISGLILKNLNYDYTNTELDFHFNTTFYKNLEKFVYLLKSNHFDWNIGLYVSARNMIYYSDNLTSPDWFDFMVLNDSFDFYVIGFELFNPCNHMFKDGVVPMNNVFRSIFSLQTFENALRTSTIAKDQIYLEFIAMPTKNDTTNEIFPTCCVTFKKFCEQDHYNTYWCADKAAAYYNKGKFASDIGAKGIITKYIDTIDPTAKCNCDNKNKFITFSMMLRGFLNQDPITNCEKLNSISLT